MLPLPGLPAAWVSALLGPPPPRNECLNLLLWGHMGAGVSSTAMLPRGRSSKLLFLDWSCIRPSLCCRPVGLTPKAHTWVFFPACPCFLSASVRREQTRHLSPQINQVFLKKVSDNLEVGEGGNGMCSFFIRNGFLLLLLLLNTGEIFPSNR